MSNWLDYFWLCSTAFIAGGTNALAGGGTLLTFPALLGALRRLEFSADVAAVLANGTSTVALFPGSWSSSWGFRREIYHLRHLLIWLLPPSVIGGAGGAWLVIQYPDQFNTLVPWLILTATALFTLQPFLVRRKAASPESLNPAPDESVLAGISAGRLAGMVLLQLVVALYGGYFGAGIGILMLTGLSLMGLTNIHQMNGLKTLLAGAINCVAAIVFLFERQVVWQYALAMMTTSIVGGYFAAHFSRQIPGKYVRYFVIAVGFLLAAYFFSLRP